MKPIVAILRRWEWIFCILILFILCLFLLGHDLLGLNNAVAAVYATAIGLATALVTFITVTILVPLVALLSSLFAMLMASLILPLLTLVTGFLAAVTAAIITLTAPLLTLVGTLWGWLMSTWIGTAVVGPLQTAFWPVISKIAPWITVGRGGGWMWKLVNKTPLGRALIKTWRVTFKRVRGEEPEQHQPKQGAASQNAGRDRSSGQGSRRRAPARKRK